ncbi:MAG: threonine/serine exporter family protein [Muribaculaceae bacterium]|nr:threonine/serine exporter family protein [Muribaculaceae bacterium]
MSESKQKSNLEISESDHEAKRLRYKHYCRFLGRYAAYMLGCGATCIRINKNIRRIAATIGMDAHIITLPHNIIVNLSDGSDDHSYHYSCAIAKVPISYYINTELSKLSWAMADGKVTFAEAENQMEIIVAHPRMSVWKVLVLVAVANASFCRLFGGDIAAMLIVALATAIGYSVKNLLFKAHTDDKIVWFASATAAALVAAILSFGQMLTSTPDIALATSVLFLIPGIPFIDSISDMIDGHYLCAFSRFMNATILTACIAAGLMIGFLLLNIKVL